MPARGLHPRPPQPGQGRLRAGGSSPDPDPPAGQALGIFQDRLIYYYYFFWSGRFWQGAGLGATLGEQGRRRYIKPCLGLLVVGADLGQVLQIRGYQLGVT